MAKDAKIPIINIVTTGTNNSGHRKIDKQTVDAETQRCKNHTVARIGPLHSCTGKQRIFQEDRFSYETQKGEAKRTKTET